MPKLKDVVGKGRGRPGWDPMPIGNSQPAKRKTLSEGFAMGPRAEETPALEQRQAHSGPRAYARGSLDKAMRLARAAPEECATRLLEDVDAQSSKAPMRSLQATWARIASQAGYSNPFELTPNLVFTVVGVLKAADYRSAANYLEAAKRKHIEAGFPMTDQLRQACRMAIRSAKRDMGPSKQAEPIPLSSIAAIRVREAQDPEGPLVPGRSCLLASWWLLREIEASHAKISHIRLDWSVKRAEFHLPNSKTDLMALGTSRAHSCSCQASDQYMCPFHLIAAQVAFASTAPNNTAEWLFPTSSGGKPTKQGWVKTFTEVARLIGLPTHWDNGAPRHTGHTARASGACHLAQAGVDLWRIQVFGRWSSAAFLRYVRSSPLASLSNLASEAAISNSIAAAKSELRALSIHGPKMIEDPHQVVPISEEMLSEAAPEPVAPASSREFVANAAAGGKIHEVLLKGGRDLLDQSQVEDVDPPSPPTPERKSSLRRRRPKPLSDSIAEEPTKPLRRVNSPRLRPCTQLVPEVPALDWSLDGAREDLDRLTPEQNALMSGFVPMSLSSTRLALAGAGGFFHFTAYLCTLCAFTSASSTVITPLMQLSALWMLPFSTSAATLGFAPVIRPLHLVAVLLICVGGFLPAADGFVVLGEFLICCYNVILHQATYAEGNDSDSELATHPLQFFLASRVANGLTCAMLFLAIPSLRQHLWALRKVKRRFFATAFLGECLSMMLGGSGSGLQQLFNLLFAVISHRLLGLGRGVEQVPVKCARCGPELQPRKLVHALNAEPALKVKDANNERLLQLRLQTTTMSSFPELQNCIRRWPGTACALAAVGLAGVGRNVQLVAPYREAYGTKDALVARTRPKSNGGVGPLHTFKVETFTTAVVIEPVIERLLKYQPESSVMLELQTPAECFEFAKSAIAFDTEVGLAERFCGALAALAPATADCGATASCLLAKELMSRHPKAADMQVAGCKVHKGILGICMPPCHRTIQAIPGEDVFDEEAAQAEVLQKAKAVPLTPLPFEVTEEAPAKIGRIRILRCFGRTVVRVDEGGGATFHGILQVILAIGSSFTSYNRTKGSLLHCVLGFVATLASALSFLACALSSPGILKPSPGSAGGPGHPEQFFASNGKRHCNACDLKQPAGVLHCDYCHVCIIGWDHHCPWMNKCIGEGNLFFFNSFLGVSLSSLGYIVLATMLSNWLSHCQQRLSTQQCCAAMEAITAAMRRHNSNAAVLEAGAAAMSGTAGWPELQAAAATNGAVEEVVGAMRRFEGDSELLASGCGALAGLAANHPLNQSSIMACRSIEVIVDAMKKFSKHARLQTMAFGALGNLAANNPNNQAAIVQADGLQRVKVALQQHQTRPVVLTAALAALWCLLKRHSGNTDLAGQLGLAELAMLALRRHPDDRGLKSMASGAMKCLVPGLAEALACQAQPLNAVDIRTCQNFSENQRQTRSREGLRICIQIFTKEHLDTS
eukprot:s554_g9.t2